MFNNSLTIRIAGTCACVGLLLAACDTDSGSTASEVVVEGASTVAPTSKAQQALSDASATADEISSTYAENNPPTATLTSTSTPTPTPAVVALDIQSALTDNLGPETLDDTSSLEAVDVSAAGTLEFCGPHQSLLDDSDVAAETAAGSSAAKKNITSTETNDPVPCDTEEKDQISFGQ